MQSSLRLQQTGDTGYFRAAVSSVIASRPIAGAKIQITDENNPEDIIEEVETDISGQSEAVELPTPPLEYSMQPAAEQPYSVYNIRISAPGFETIEISGAEILPGQTALQNVSLMPMENSLGESEELYVIPPHTLFGNYPPKIPENEIKNAQETGEIVLSRVVIPAGVRIPQPPDTACVPFFICTAGTVKLSCGNIGSWCIYFVAGQPLCNFPGCEPPVF